MFLKSLLEMHKIGAHRHGASDCGQCGRQQRECGEIQPLRDGEDREIYNSLVRTMYNAMVFNAHRNGGFHMVRTFFCNSSLRPP